MLSIKITTQIAWVLLVNIQQGLTFQKGFILDLKGDYLVSSLDALKSGIKKERSVTESVDNEARYAQVGGSVPQQEERHAEDHCLGGNGDTRNDIYSFLTEYRASTQKTEDIYIQCWNRHQNGVQSQPRDFSLFHFVSDMLRPVLGCLIVM